MTFKSRCAEQTAVARPPAPEPTMRTSQLTNSISMSDSFPCLIHEGYCRRWAMGCTQSNSTLANIFVKSKLDETAIFDPGRQAVCTAEARGTKTNGRNPAQP
jgi:hypothetical protein